MIIRDVILRAKSLESLIFRDLHSSGGYKSEDDSNLSHLGPNTLRLLHVPEGSTPAWMEFFERCRIDVLEVKTSAVYGPQWSRMVSFPRMNVGHLSLVVLFPNHVPYQHSESVLNILTLSSVHLC